MNFTLLAEKIEHCGLTKSALAEGLGLTRQGLYNKLSGDNEFTGSELKNLSKLLGLSEQERNAIFFADDVGENAYKSTNHH
jgi:transcriptional regulator with XRE-family HTH domain